MRIGLLTDCYKPGVNGIIRFISLHKRILEEQGHEVFVFTWGRKHPKDEPGVIRSFGLPFVRPGYHVGWRYSRQAQSVLQTLDVLHANQPLLSGALAVQYGRRYGIPVAFTGHSAYDLLGVTALPFIPLPLYRAILRPYMRWFTDRCGLVTVSSPAAEETLRVLGVTRPIEIIPVGIDVAHYRQSESRLTRASLRLPTGTPLALSVGRLSPEKNVRFLLQALARPELAHAHLLLVGDGHERRSLETYAGQLGLGERAHFAGEVGTEEVPAYVSLADFTVTASTIEMLPISILESLAAGLPILGLDAPWIRHVVQPGINGLLAGPDTGSFARAWAGLLEDATLRARLAEGARVAGEQYDARCTTARLVSHYECLIAANSQVRAAR